MSTHVVYHRSDFDGRLSAAVCLHFIPDAVLHPWEYKEPTPVIPDDCETLYIVDLSCRDLMDDPRLIWIDHRKTAMNDYDPKIKGLRIDGVAACRLCWSYFNFGNDKSQDGWTVKHWRDRTASEPLVLTLAGEYDIFDLHDPRSLYLQHGLTVFSDDPRELVKLFEPDHLGDNRTRALIDQGRAIETYNQKLDAGITKEKCYIREWEGFKFCILNTSKKGSRQFVGIDGMCDAVMIWNFDGKQIGCSLYDPWKSGIDLSPIAKKYGGGGHAGACGFTMTWGQMFEAGLIDEGVSGPVHSKTEIEVAKIKGYMDQPCPQCKKYLVVRNGWGRKCDGCGEQWTISGGP